MSQGVHSLSECAGDPRYSEPGTWGASVPLQALAELAHCYDISSLLCSVDQHLSDKLRRTGIYDFDPWQPTWEGIIAWLLLAEHTHLDRTSSLMESFLVRNASRFSKTSNFLVDRNSRRLSSDMLLRIARGLQSRTDYIM